MRDRVLLPYTLVVYTGSDFMLCCVVSIHHYQVSQPDVKRGLPRFVLAAYTLGLPAPLPPLAQQLLPCMLRLNFSQLLSTSFSLASCPCPAPTHCLSPLTEQITSSTRPQIRDQRPPTLRSTCRQMRKAGAPNLIMSGRLAALISAITAALFSPSVVAQLHTRWPQLAHILHLRCCVHGDHFHNAIAIAQYET